MFKKLVTKRKDKMLDPFASVHPMRPGSVIVSAVESGDRLAHKDTSTPPPPPPPVRPVKIGLPPLHFCGPLPPVSAQHSDGNGFGGGLHGEVGPGPPQPRGGPHHGEHRPAPWSPTQPTQDMQGALFRQWTPDKKHVNVLPNTTHLEPPTNPLLKKFVGTLERQDVSSDGP